MSRHGASMSRMIITREFPPGDYMERLNQAYRAWDAAVKEETSDGGSTPNLLIEGTASEQLREEYMDLKDAATEAAKRSRRYIRLQGVSRSVKRGLERRHPPRTEDADEDALKADKSAGMNLETVEDDLLFATIIEPEFAGREAWLNALTSGRNVDRDAEFDQWADEDLTEGEFQLLVRDSWELADVAQFDPKSLPALPTQRSDATSE